MCRPVWTIGAWKSRPTDACSVCTATSSACELQGPAQAHGCMRAHTESNKSETKMWVLCASIHALERPQIMYYDGQFNDSRLNVTLACSSAAAGATVMNYTECKQLIKVCGARSGTPMQHTVQAAPRGEWKTPVAEQSK